MRICIFNKDRIGIVDRDNVIDVTDLFDRNPRWPLPIGAWIIRQVEPMRPQLNSAAKHRDPLPLSSVRLESPVASPLKIIGAPINYKAHIDEANLDQQISHGHIYTSLKRYGLFLKATSSLIGPADAVQRRFPDRRTDHEVELAVVIGREARMVTREAALDYVLGYTIGLDITVRGQEWPGFRKSVDTYSLLGPWLVTADEIGDPNSLKLQLSVNGTLRQNSSTALQILNVQELIEYASAFYTLYPGDVIMTGTPEGVGPIEPGDVIDAEIEHIGRMQIQVAQAFADNYKA